MKNQHLYSRLTISYLIERSFIFFACLILIITLLSSLYTSQRNTKVQRFNNSNKIHEILLNLIEPALNISNVNEVRRLLQMASSKDETFVVVDNVGNILMPDYEKIGLVRSLTKEGRTTPDCKQLQNTFKSISDEEYWVNCTIIRRNDVLSQDENLGTLFSFDKYNDLIFSPMLFFLIGPPFFVVLFLSVWFRQILHRRLLRPLVILGNRIMDRTRSPTTTETSLGDIGKAPYEVFSIKRSFEELLDNLQREYQYRMESEKKEALFDLAAKVAHDICSPLTVMEMTLETTTRYIPETDGKIQKEAIQCMRDIANNLLNRYREPLNLTTTNSQCTDSSKPVVMFLSTLIELVISQKRQEWQNHPCSINFSIQGKAKFSCIQVTSNNIKSMLSNLLNNAYASLENNREVNITLKHYNMLVLEISDRGKGIPEDKIHAVLLGESLKHQGKGLGLSSARQLMKNLGGELMLKSRQGEGTSVTLIFNNIVKPRWFPEQIKILSGENVVILDDDKTIHNLWRKKFDNGGYNIYYFTKSLELKNWVANHPDYKQNTVFLIDYELHTESLNGLEILKELQIENRGYLVTSHAVEEPIQSMVEQAGLWLIPKALVNYL